MGVRRLLGIILLAAAAALPSGATSASPGDYSGKEIGLVLVPADQESARPEDVHFIRPPPPAAARERREVHHGHKKYQRLAHSVHVQSDIRYRYATTLVTSEVHNPEPGAREIFLTVILPDTAFISRFAIEVSGQLFVAFVKEKEAAWREYQSAVEKGRTAGHVGISARHSNHFRVSVNTEAHASVTFYLLYEELLQRRAGIYEHVINLTPRQKLKDFAIEVHILENRNLTHLRVPALRRHEVSVAGEDELRTSERRGRPDVRVDGGPEEGSPRAVVRYRPKLSELQKRLRSRHALQFVVEYDVDRKDVGGEVQVVDGYFVHFVAPEHLPPMPKHVVFVLDTSGSMEGKKMLQTQSAMKTILSELRDGSDYMTIVSFSDKIKTWEWDGNVVAPVSRASKLAAIDHVKKLQAEGNTNINEALLEALSVVAGAVALRKEAQPLVFFLTDGHPTVGETDSGAILENVEKANEECDAAIFSLAFGRASNYTSLKLLSLQNNAFARKIYVAADASLQLEGFYKEVSSPILRDVRFRYQNDEILSRSLTSTNFHTYYQGSEMVVAGRLPPSASGSGQKHSGATATNGNKLIEYEIHATQAQGQEYSVAGAYNGSAAYLYGPETITETVFGVLPRVHSHRVNFLERLWAYLTINNLLERVAKGEINSCADENGANSLARAKREIESLLYDDEDYDGYSGSGDGADSTEEDEYYYSKGDELEYTVDDIMDVVGDADIVMCNNLERALYLSLKYEFVTPLTSLVVVKPDSGAEQGDFGEIGVRFMSGAVRSGPPAGQPWSRSLGLALLLTAFVRLC